MGTQPPILLFTAFERSGDEHAAPVIAQLKKAHPDWEIYAFGGPRMEAAGAILLESTTGQGAMLLGAVALIRSHQQRLKRLERWLAEHPITLHMPVDSPAANWSYCALVRKTQPRAKIMHLVAPQMWAWAPWRIRKMKRLSDHVLCLLPFEPDWFGKRGMPGTFVGHPVFDAEAQRERDAAAQGQDLPAGDMKLALLPGSRTGEIRANWPTMLGVVRELERKHPGLKCVVGATDENIAGMIRETLPGGEGKQGGGSLEIRVGETESVLAWADAALATSGTVSLHAAAHGTPMAIVYRVNWWSWNLLGRFLIQTRTFTLPNILGEWMGAGRIVPEFVPHFGKVGPVAEAVEELLRKGPAWQAQRAHLMQLRASFAGKKFAEEAAAKVEEMVG